METRIERFEIPVDDDSIAGTLLTPARLLPGVLFVHGWGGSQAQDLARARAAAGLGCACLTFDLRGHARHAEHAELVTRDQNLHDLVAAYDLLAGMAGVDPSAIAVIGSSYGAYLAAILTTMRQVRWLAMHAPALYKDADWGKPKRSLHADPELMAYRRRAIAPGEGNRALDACAAFRGDVLIVESENDGIVPHAVIMNYLAAFSAGAHSLTSRIITGASHGLADEESQRAYSLLLTNWITEMIVGARLPAEKPRLAAVATR
jgi:pimeloyl-ACP methyl ester carboxylesterase